MIWLASCGAEAGPSPSPSSPAEPRLGPVDTRPSPDCSPSAPNSDGTPKRARPGPPSRPPETLVLDPGDFGPQASSFSLIGMQWWNWEGGGSWEPCDSFDVRVVVYRGLSLETVKRRYPSAKSRADLVDRGLPDVRYVEYDAALAHLDGELAEIADEPLLQSMRNDLTATRHRIIEALGG